jgi:hypothetical protein
MCTPNASKNDDDNGNGKKLRAFYFNCVLRDDEVRETFYSLHRYRRLVLNSYCTVYIAYPGTLVPGTLELVTRG